VQDWVQRTGADPISMPSEFFEHPQTKDRLLSGVMEDVQAYQAGIQIAVIFDVAYLFVIPPVLSTIAFKL
jgi:hypothetical protein